MKFWITDKLHLSLQKTSQKRVTSYGVFR